MAKHELETPWPQIIREEVRMTSKELASGHPSAPGFREEKQPRAGIPTPGNGQPGVPKIRPGKRGTRGFPANTGGMYPVQPETIYDGEHDF